jgi:hypothetical protein
LIAVDLFFSRLEFNSVIQVDVAPSTTVSPLYPLGRVEREPISMAFKA